MAMSSPGDPLAVEIEPMARLLEITRDILEEREISSALLSIARGVRDLFAFRYVTIVAADGRGGDLHRRVLLGYSEAVVRERLNERVPRADILDVLRPSYAVFENCFFMPAERETDWDLAIYTGELPIDAPRLGPQRWHERDALVLVLPDEQGEMLGYMSVDGPMNGLIPARETLRRMQLFVNLVGLALAKARAYAAEIERSRLLQASHARLRHEATHDSLTRLPNRQFFSERLERSLAAARVMPDRTYAVLFVDLDEFKSINDSLGHIAGDRLLIAIAQRLRNAVEEGDFVARIGGDEFAVLLDDRAGFGGIESVVASVQRFIAEPLEVDGRMVFTTASIGIAIVTPSYDRIEDIVRDADTAMYYAKGLGRGRHALFDHHMHTAASRRLALTTDLRLAIDQQQFVLAYQPIVDLATQKIVALEALVRWRHPTNGEMLPVDFVPLAEDVGLMVAIGRSIFRQACLDLAACKAEAPDAPLSMNVNLSVPEVLQHDLEDFVASSLREFDLEPRDIVLEITESAILRSGQLASRALERLRESGVRLCIDDFGTGYSSLRYLREFPFDSLKIDRSFIEGPEGRLGSEPIITMLIQLAASLDVDVVAEGIESAAQAADLLALGCKYGQGYHYCRPLPGPKVRRLIAERSALARESLRLT